MKSYPDVMAALPPIVPVLSIVFAVLGVLIAAFGAYLIFGTKPRKKNLRPGITYLICGVVITAAFLFLFAMSR
jgi:hypothetical protein